jgi:transmembrane sensor
MRRASVLLTPQIKAEAATWLALLHADNRTAADEEGFQAWLREDPAHAAAFDSVTSMWDVSAGARTVRVELRPVNRRAVVGGMGLLALIGGSLTVWRAGYAGVYETEVGEQKRIVLKDGSYAFLDTDTHIRVDFSDEVRNIELQLGRANFRVAPDNARPFVVTAADHRISARHSNFDVSRIGDTVSVLLVEGAATVESEGRHAKKSTVIETGQRLVAKSVDAVNIDRPDPRPLLAWQTGQAIFANETLEDAVAEMNRYSSVTLEISDPAISKLRLSGVYRVGDVAAFARSLARLLPIEVRETGDRVQLLADPQRLAEG